MATDSTTTNLFKTLIPNQPIDVLLLVENSQAMSFIWDDLRDRYLAKVMDRLKAAIAPSASTASVWVLESQPLQSSSTTQPRQYHDPHHALREVCLNYMSENRISSKKVSTAIDFLSNLANSREPGRGHALHLIIVAVSAPIDNVHLNATKDMNGGPEYSASWSYLAERLAQANIHCHTLTRAKEDMTALNTLFNETLRLGRSIEDSVSFPDDSEVSLRLSMAPSVPKNLQSSGQANPPPRPTRIMMPPRRNTFPFDASYTEHVHAHDVQPPAARPSDMDAPPSLVTQLQQRHGLTKKKVYGAKPQRKPFFKEERVDRHVAGPAQPTIHPGYLSDSSLQQHGARSPSGGRMMSLSKVDRIARIQANPTDIHPRRYLGWTGRGSRLSSPELVTEPLGSPTSTAGLSDISPTTSYISSDVSSPISPASVDDYYGVQAVPAQTAMAAMPAIVSGGHSDPTWLQSRYSAVYASSNPNLAPTHQGYYIPPIPASIPAYYEMAPPSRSSSVYNEALSKDPSVSLLPSEIPKPPAASHLPPSSKKSQSSKKPSSTSSTTAGVASVPTTTPLVPSPLPAKKLNHTPEEDDDEYFELDQKYVEDTTNLFNEFFPNAATKIPETLLASGTVKPASSYGTSDTIASSSRHTGSAPKYVQVYLPGGDDSNGSIVVAAPSPPSSLAPGSVPAPTSAVGLNTSSSTSLASTSLGPAAAAGNYASSDPFGFEECFPSSVMYHAFSPPSALPPTIADPQVQGAMHPRPIVNSYQPPMYPSAHGTSSLTGWAG